MSGQDRALLLMIKGHLSELPPEGQAKVNAIADEFRERLANDVDGHATLAFALVGAEMAADE